MGEGTDAKAPMQQTGQALLDIVRGALHLPDSTMPGSPRSCLEGGGSAAGGVGSSWLRDVEKMKRHASRLLNK